MEELRIPFGPQSLAAALHRPQGPARAAAVLAHGLQSSMQSAKLTKLGQALARQGVLCLRFDHLGCGHSPGRESDTTLTDRRNQFLAAAGQVADLAPGLPVCYLGSSFGGTVALCAADIKAPACIVVWSAPIYLEELFTRMDQAPEVPDMPALARDIARFDLEAIIARRSRVLFVHGQNDEVVPVDQARRGHELAAEPKELLVLPGADHRISDPAAQAKAISATLTWVSRFSLDREGV